MVCITSGLAAFAVLATAVVAQDPYIHIENTQPPANFYVTHCTAMIEGDLFGCKDASSEPFKLSCDDKSHSGIQTRSICNSAEITINWDTLETTFVNSVGESAKCTLSKDGAGASCTPQKVDDVPNCKAVGYRHDGLVPVPGPGASDYHGTQVTLYKDIYSDNKVVGHTGADKVNDIQNEKWVDVTSELPWVFVWKGSFHFNWDYCIGKYGDQTDLKGTVHKDVDEILFGTQVNQYCEIKFRC